MSNSKTKTIKLSYRKARQMRQTLKTLIAKEKTSLNPCSKRISIIREIIALFQQ